MTVVTPGDSKESNYNKLGLYMKATLEIKDLCDPYVSLKYVRNGFTNKTDDNIDPMSDDHITTKDEYTVSGLEFSLGVKKKIDAITFDAEMKFAGAPKNETTFEETTENNISKVTEKLTVKAEGESEISIGLRATYEF